jgi:hypothetical protein
MVTNVLSFLFTVKVKLDHIVLTTNKKGYWKKSLGTNHW